MNPAIINLITTLCIFSILFFQSKKKQTLPHQIEGRLKYFHFLVVFLMIAANINVHRFIDFTINHYPQLKEHLNSFPGIFGESFNWFLWFFYIVACFVVLSAAFLMMLKPQGKKWLIQTAFAVFYINFCFQFYTGMFRGVPEKQELSVLLHPYVIFMFLFSTGVYGSFAYFYSRDVVVEKFKLSNKNT